MYQHITNVIAKVINFAIFIEGKHFRIDFQKKDLNKVLNFILNEIP